MREGRASIIHLLVIRVMRKRNGDIARFFFLIKVKKDFFFFCPSKLVQSRVQHSSFDLCGMDL